MSADRLIPGRSGLVAVLVLMLAACGGGGGGGSGGDDDGRDNSAKSCAEQFNPPAAKTTPAECQPKYYSQCPELGARSPFNVSAPAACDGVTVSNYEVAVGDYTVKYLVLTPSTGGKKGLYVGLHWRSGNGATMANQMRLSELAKARNITVVLPDSPYSAIGQATKDWDFAGNDVVLTGVIADAKAKTGVKNPLVLSGASSGVAGAIRFYCSQRVQLDGLLLVAAGALTESSAASCLTAAKAAVAPAPIVFVQGVDDQAYEDVVTSYGEVSSINGCAGAGETVALNEQVDIKYNVTCSGGDGVALVSVKNGGHNWPGMDRPIPSNPLTDNIPSTDSSGSFNLFGKVSYDFDATIQGYDLVRYVD